MKPHGAPLWRRRIKLIKNVFAGDEFSDPAKLSGNAVNRYSDYGELDFYAAKTNEGLSAQELEAIGKSAPRAGGRVLVAGAGAGRETFALEKMGFECVGIEGNRQMVERAREIAASRRSKVFFENVILPYSNSQPGISPRLVRPFDFVYLSPGLSSHIATRSARVAMLANLRALAPHGILCAWPDVCRFGPRNVHYWASLAFRVRARVSGYSFEPGDTLRSFFGAKNASGRLDFYHYYRDENEFAEELRSAGWTPTNLGGGFVLGR